MRLPVYVQLYYGGDIGKFAEAVGWSPQVVRRWLLPFNHHEHVTPRPAAVIAIFVETRGRVKPNDLYPLPRLKLGGRPSHLVKADRSAQVSIVA